MKTPKTVKVKIKSDEPAKMAYVDDPMEAIQPSTPFRQGEQIDAPPAPKPMSMIQKVNLSHALTSALNDQDLKSKIAALPSGQVLWEILTEAVEARVELILQGPKEHAPALAVDLSQTLIGATQSIQEMRALASSFYNTPLVQTLSTLLRLTGQPELFAKVNQLPMPQAAYAPVPYQPQGQPVSTAVQAPRPTHNGPTANPYITDHTINNPPSLAQANGMGGGFDPYRDF